jgi:hypothetical protein
MPLPLPNLDTRRWLDLVDEGRALIPRYAPAWTDHNAHDPGITLMELLAWFVEQDVYRANRIPDHHRRKVLALAGFVPQPPQPARTVLTFRLNPAASPHLIPTGLTIATISGSAEYPFRTLAPLTILPIQISALQVFDGQRFVDQTRTWHDGLSFPLFGENPVVASSDPDQQPAFYIGLNQAILSGQRATFWLWFDGLRTDAAERQRIAELATWLETACQPIQPHRTCPPPESRRSSSWPCRASTTR